MISKQNLSPTTTYTLEACTINDTEGCKCDDAVKVKAIKEVLENSKDVNSNLIIQKVKHILKPIKYSDEYFEEDDTKIKLEPVTVKTEPFIKAESVKTEPEDDTKIKLEPVSVKTEPLKQAESIKTEEDEVYEFELDPDDFEKLKQEQEKEEKQNITNFEKESYGGEGDGCKLLNLFSSHF